MEDKSYELFSELLDREHESLIPDKPIPTFNIWDIRNEDGSKSKAKTVKEVCDNHLFELYERKY